MCLVPFRRCSLFFIIVSFILVSLRRWWAAVRRTKNIQLCSLSLSIPDDVITDDWRGGGIITIIIVRRYCLAKFLSSSSLIRLLIISVVSRTSLFWPSEQFSVKWREIIIQKRLLDFCGRRSNFDRMMIKTKLWGISTTKMCCFGKVGPGLLGMH